uniref:Uncharacterized protein n=1 Tax=Lactuca sativa TaxID=4236 RepID=A0A9R1W640_LACSA|nr:hypothetical protein LSAT_V11C300147120 [Lactuca sativa]
MQVQLVHIQMRVPEYVRAVQFGSYCRVFHTKPKVSSCSVICIFINLYLLFLLQYDVIIMMITNIRHDIVGSSCPFVFLNLHITCIILG